MLGVAASSGVLEQELKFLYTLNIDAEFLLVIINDGSVGLDGESEVVPLFGEVVPLVGQVRELVLPHGLSFKFPTLVGALGAFDLLPESGKKLDNLLDGAWGGGVGELCEGGDQRSVGLEFRVEVCHVSKLLANCLNPALKLDEGSSCTEAGDEGNGLLAGGDSGLVLGHEKLKPSELVFTGSGTFNDSSVNTDKLSNGVLKLGAGLSPKLSGLSNNLLANISLLGVVGHLVRIFRNKSVA